MRSLMCAALAFSLSVPAALAVSTPASAAKWWRCSDGYTLEGPNNAAVRCVRPEATITVALAPCPPGATTVTNPSPGITRNRDQCLIPINRTFTDRICQLPTDRYNARPGPDNCSRVTAPADSKPPSVEVQR